MASVLGEPDQQAMPNKERPACGRGSRWGPPRGNTAAKTDAHRDRGDLNLFSEIVIDALGRRRAAGRIYSIGREV